MKTPERLLGAGLSGEADPASSGEYDSAGRQINRWRLLRSKMPETPMLWRTSAACNPNVNSMVNPAWQWADHERMLAFCSICPVTQECLAEQQALQIDGVWGGRVFMMASNGRTTKQRVRRPCLECDDPAVARGLCNLHYQRHRSQGAT